MAVAVWLTEMKHSSSSMLSLITYFICCLVVSSLLKGVCPTSVSSPAFSNDFSWDHAVDLNEDFRILWTIINQDITFEIQARTLGYVGFGFSLDGKIAGSDMAIGWVDKGQTYFQDRHVKRNGDAEPAVDPSQDYILIMGYENATHTVLRFRRKLDTCDSMHDIPITLHENL
ncbi:MOXD1 homolog 2-like [Teleopsis dalmanni]|uniref:MOXD1 homolog 2-like n=1 Tax=Teleopsis dalmanni TaxID=139649 RepID=UPI0018CF2CCE|nr:MOXD1 homolog 2-like [Teleopsis dalmanni]